MGFIKGEKGAARKATIAALQALAAGIYIYVYMCLYMHVHVHIYTHVGVCAST